MGGWKGKREQIMSAAEALFSAHRFHEITVEDIARLAGVGKGTIYRYFDNKESLFFEVALSGYEQLCEAVESHLQDSGAYEDVLFRVSDAVGAFFLERHRVWHMMQAEDRRQLRRRGSCHQAWQSHRDRLHNALVQILRRGVEAGGIRADLPLEALASLLLGMLRSTTRHHGGTASLSHSQVAELFLRGACFTRSSETKDDAW